MASPIETQIQEHLISIMLETPIGPTREATAAAVVKRMQPFLRKTTAYYLRSGHVSALVKFRAAVLLLGNDIHIRDQMREAKGAPFQLTEDEWTNFSYLRLHGLVAKVRGKRGNWLLTPRGAAFLSGNLEIPRITYAMDGHVIGHGGEPVSIRDFRGQLPEFFKVPEPGQVEPAPQLKLI